MLTHKIILAQSMDSTDTSNIYPLSYYTSSLYEGSSYFPKIYISTIWVVTIENFNNSNCRNWGLLIIVIKGIEVAFEK